MLYMYFSKEDSNEVAIDHPKKKLIVMKPELYNRVRHNEELSARVFLDTHLLEIRDSPDELVSKSKTSVDLGRMPSTPLLVYTSLALITADLRKMTSDDFKKTYLAPLDEALRASKEAKLRGH